MKSHNIQRDATDLTTASPCLRDSVFVPFTEEDTEDLAQYAFDMGYMLEPQMTQGNSDKPARFKVSSMTNPSLYGWISKVSESDGNSAQEKFIYGFYRRHRYFNKYPITFNVTSFQMRRILKRNAERDPRQTDYFRTVFGILDLEPQITPLSFIFSWLYSCKFIRV